MTTQQALAKLKDLYAKAGETMYERVKLAAAILADRDYVSQTHGDEAAARVALEDGYFSDLLGSCSLGELLTIYAKFPDAQ